MMNFSCLKTLFYLLCVFVWGDTQQVWRSEDSSGELLLSFWALGPGDWSWIIRLSRRCLSHQASSRILCWGIHSLSTCCLLMYCFTTASWLSGILPERSPCSPGALGVSSGKVLSALFCHCESGNLSFILTPGRVRWGYNPGLTAALAHWRYSSTIPPLSSLLANFQINFYFQARIWFFFKFLTLKIFFSSFGIITYSK